MPSMYAVSVCMGLIRASKNQAAIRLDSAAPIAAWFLLARIRPVDTLNEYIEGIGLLGPGLTDWLTSQAVLSGQQPYQPHKTVHLSPALLPAAERRRSCAIVKLTLATGLEAIAAAGLDAASLPSVFSASGGDGENCHIICEMLASDDRQISPTRFHNSVHNVAAGYWSIATGAMTTSSVLSAFDASFGAGLLEALTQVVVDDTRTVLLACDTAYPEPLHSARPIPDASVIDHHLGQR